MTEQVVTPVCALGFLKKNLKIKVRLFRSQASVIRIHGTSILISLSQEILGGFISQRSETHGTAESVSRSLIT